jgi:hypothetical protein
MERMAEMLAGSKPCVVALLGSGETAAPGRAAFVQVFRRLQQPIRVAVLDTPAGFQPNAARVAEKMAEFVLHHLQEFRPQVQVIHARYKGGPFDTDAPAAVDQVNAANCIFAGPGSPGFLVHQLQNSRVLEAVRRQHLHGAALVFASAAALAMSAHALPIYEIYKAGSDLHWLAGLDMLGPYGYHLTVVPHWNNREGGAELDTSHCFMGAERFERLRALLPSQETILGIDEHTACVFDLAAEQGEVLGKGSLTLLHEQHPLVIYHAGDHFPLSVLRGEAHTHPERLAVPTPAPKWADDGREPGAEASLRKLESSDDGQGDAAGAAALPRLLPRLLTRW